MKYDDMVRAGGILRVGKAVSQRQQRGDIWIGRGSVLVRYNCCCPSVPLNDPLCVIVMVLEGISAKRGRYNGPAGQTKVRMIYHWLHIRFWRLRRLQIARGLIGAARR